MTGPIFKSRGAKLFTVAVVGQEIGERNILHTLNDSRVLPKEPQARQARQGPNRSTWPGRTRAGWGGTINPWEVF